MKHLTANLEAALEYAQHSLSVTPCGLDKKPLVKWQPYQKKRATEEGINAWWGKYPLANPGTITGAISGLLVFDIDVVKHNGFASLIDAGLDLSNIETPVSETPTGGQHWFFKYPENENIGCGVEILPGVDYRGEGGVIVLPPSYCQYVKNGKEIKGSYKWLKSFDEVPLAPVPSALISFIKEFAFRGYVQGCKADNADLTKPYKTLQFLTEGRRDNDLFHIANCLIKGGCETDIALQILDILASNCNPPFPEKEVQAKIKSVLSRCERRERNLTEDIKKWIFLTSGYFSLTEAYDPLQILTSQKNTVHQIMHRFVKEGFVERHPTKNGLYRLVDTECEEIDFLNASTEGIHILWPFEIEKYVRTLPKNIIVVAGEPNAGKTAFLLNVVRLNMFQHSILYFSSEMGAIELKDRLRKFDDICLSDWKFKAKERASNFADVIKPGAVNIIDFLEVHDEFYKIGGYIKEIYDKLNTGIAIIALQKNKGVEYVLGCT